MLSDRIPVIRLWNFLLVPLQGEVLDQQAEQMINEVLGEIQREDIEAVVIDISGLALVDSHFCATLAQLTTAARLMGAQTLLTGLHPDIALTLLQMGIDLPDLRTCSSMEQAMETLGVTLEPRADRFASADQDDYESELER